MAFNLRRPPPLNAKHDAYPYQLDAVRAIKDLPYAAVFHEQGLGKTKIAIDLLLCWLTEDVVDTVFVVTKKTLVQNWIDELKFHSHITPRILSTNRRQNSIALNSAVLIYVMNYEVISSNIDLLTDFLDTCRVGSILDESQKIKNPDAKLTVCLHSITHHFARRVIVTGTPVANRPFDIWSQIRFLDDGEALGSSFPAFKKSLDLPRDGPAISLCSDPIQWPIQRSIVIRYTQDKAFFNTRNQEYRRNRIAGQDNTCAPSASRTSSIRDIRVL